MSSSQYVFDKYAATCDICGTPRKASELTVRDGIKICIRHPGFKTARELDRLNAKTRWPIVQAVPNNKPLAPLPTWEAEESRILDLIVSVAPFDTRDVTGDGQPGITGLQSIQAAGWGAVYLAALIAEARRPAKWITRARTKLAELADYLITTQVPAGLGSGLQGAMQRASDPNVLWAQDTGVGCLALCRAYQILGTPGYLAAAKFAATAIVAFQAGDKYFNSIKDASGTAHFYGPVSSRFDFSDTHFDGQFYPGDLVCMWALSVLKTIAGDIVIGDTTTGGGFWTSAPARLISVSIGQMRDFWINGIADAGTSTAITGLSASTPREYFGALGGGSLVPAGDAKWHVDPAFDPIFSVTSDITTASWAAGMRAIFEVDGLTAQVSSCWSFLGALTDSGTFALPSGYSTKHMLETTRGPFDAAIAPAKSFTSAGLISSSFYDFASAGLLAPITAQLSAVQLATIKETIGMPRPRTAEGTPRDGRTEDLGRLGLSGLSFQPSTSASRRQESVTRAAQVGFLYRYKQAFMGDE